MDDELYYVFDDYKFADYKPYESEQFNIIDWFRWEDGFASGYIKDLELYVPDLLDCAFFVSATIVLRDICSGELQNSIHFKVGRIQTVEYCIQLHHEMCKKQTFIIIPQQDVESIEHESTGMVSEIHVKRIIKSFEDLPPYVRLFADTKKPKRIKETDRISYYDIVKK